MSKVFPNSAQRNVARARGHLKAAERFNFENDMQARDFNVAKANTTLQIGILHETKRMADAEEIQACIVALSADPEALTTIDEALWEKVEDKVHAWLNHIVRDPSETEDEDVKA